MGALRTSAVAVALAFLLGCGAEEDAPRLETTVGTEVLAFRERVPRNIVFLSIDTTRKDHLGAYGSERGLTPFLDRIAEESVVLTDHQQCSSWTFPSIACTLAGRSTLDLGYVPRFFGLADRPPLPLGTPLLATWLSANGYRTLLASANVYLSTRTGLAEGYDEAILRGPNAGAVYAEGVGALAAFGKDRFFLHLHFMEPHASYDPPERNVPSLDGIAPWSEDLTHEHVQERWRKRYPELSAGERADLEANLRALYEGEVRTLDERLAAIWRDMDEKGLLDDALVVVWNDHGEQFWEHGNQTHGFELTGEENDGIVFFWAKNIVPRRFDGPTTAVDIVPTLLDLEGIPIPSDVTGTPIGAAPYERPRFAETYARLGGVHAVTKDGWKLQYFFDGKLDLYDRNADPREQINRYDAAHPRARELWPLLRPRIEKMRDLVEDAPAPVWPDERR